MENARALTEFPDFKDRIAAFVSLASTEITTHDEKLIPELAETLPTKATVYVAHTPKASLHDVVRVSCKVQSAGLAASPHIVARRVTSANALRDGLTQLCAAGVQQVLLVAGDCETPMGPYRHTLDLIDSGVLTGSGISRIGVAGHPEGMKGVDAEQLWQALHHKQQFGRRTGIRVHIATQFGFDPEGVCNWVRTLAQREIALPVHVGLAGPTSFTKLVRFAMLCGVGASLHSASKNLKAVGNVARMATTPEQMIPALVECGAGVDLGQIVQPHFFTFGGALASARWIRGISQGNFDIRTDGKLALHS